MDHNIYIFLRTEGGGAPATFGIGRALLHTIALDGGEILWREDIAISTPTGNDINSFDNREATWKLLDHMMYPLDESHKNDETHLHYPCDSSCIER